MRARDYLDRNHAKSNLHHESIRPWQNKEMQKNIKTSIQNYYQCIYNMHKPLVGSK